MHPSQTHSAMSTRRTKRASRSSTVEPGHPSEAGGWRSVVVFEDVDKHPEEVRVVGVRLSSLEVDLAVVGGVEVEVVTAIGTR